ncbi:MAG TPA: type III pantothenate kinase [Prolixibacteraceae bacterium]|nr:type III pantothenate kinase [Prolixibacteraceae bacterium]
MSNLVIDIGNTRTKVAVFEKNRMLKSSLTDTLTNENIEQILEEFSDIENAIISSVRNNTNEIQQIVSQHIPYCIVLDHNTPIPIENHYQTPQTLGKDRLAAAVGANYVYPNTNLLIIDAGTAITYDFVNNSNQYKGGFITPGINMRFKALHHFTQKLPLLQAIAPQHIEGINTELSIIGGIQYGIEGEAKQIIEHFKLGTNKLMIILTGGDTKYFEKLLKNYKFVALEIILLGLNIILEFNKIHNYKK